jgi:DNA-binding NtrC family response regulator
VSLPADMSKPVMSKPVAVETVLFLDGEVLVRMPIAQYLRDCGYRVLEAVNVDEAKTILQKPDIHVDVVLSDVEMPGPMNGFGFAQWARSVRPGLKIILAASPERATHAATELCEHGPLLMKPYDPKIVLEHIKRLLAARERQGGS